MQTSKAYAPPEPSQPFPHPILSPLQEAKPWLIASLAPILLHRDSPYSALSAAKGQCATTCHGDTSTEQNQDSAAEGTWLAPELQAALKALGSDAPCMVWHSQKPGGGRQRLFIF